MLVAYGTNTLYVHLNHPINMEISENTFENMLSPQFNAADIVNLNYEGNISLEHWVNGRVFDDVSVFPTQVKFINNTFRNNYMPTSLVSITALSDLTVSGNRYENNVDIHTVDERSYNSWLLSEQPNAC